jgi:hypothetical protein
MMHHGSISLQDAVVPALTFALCSNWAWSRLHSRTRHKKVLSLKGARVSNQPNGPHSLQSALFTSCLEEVFSEISYIGVFLYAADRGYTVSALIV